MPKGLFFDLVKIKIKNFTYNTLANKQMFC